MLHHDVVDAIAAGQFHVWSIETIEEGIEILTGVPAGVRKVDGGWRKGSVFQRVEEALASMYTNLEGKRPLKKKAPDSSSRKRG